MLTVEELLMPRYKVIADYPQNCLKVGDIISFELQHVEIAKYTALNGDPIKLAVMEKTVQKYPHLFQPLPWWSDRRVEDLLSIDQIWKEIEGYEGLYQISNLGLIKSLAKEVGRSFKGEVNYKAKRQERLLKFNQRKDKYLTIQLSKLNIATTFYVHILAANAFLEKIDGKNYINHLDNNRSNPMVINLERCTQSENLEHAVKTNNYSEKVKQRFDRSPNKAEIIERIKNAGKYKAQPVRQMGANGEILNCFSSVAEAARVTGFSSTGIHSQITGKSNATKYRFLPATREEYELLKHPTP